MTYRILNFVIRHALLVTAVLLVLLFSTTALAIGGYARSAGFEQKLSQQELTQEPKSQANGCPAGMRRFVGSVGPICMPPMKHARDKGYSEGVYDTFDAIRKGETPCPVTTKSRSSN